MFYDVRSKLQPFTALRAYSGLEVVSSLCWQRLKPVIVNESICTAETALLGGAAEDSILMPDPLPSVASTGPSFSTAVPEETPQHIHLKAGGSLARLRASRSNFKDDMEVFSPLVDVQPITPTLDKLWDKPEGPKKDHLSVDKKLSSLFNPSSSRRSPFAEDGVNDHPIFYWKSSSTSKQDDARSSYAESVSTHSSKVEDSSIMPPEAWGGEKLPNKFTKLHLPSCFGTSTSGGLTSGLAYSDLSSSLSQTSPLTGSNSIYENLRIKDVSSNQEPSTLGFPENLSSSSTSLSLGAKGFTRLANLDSPRTTSLTLPERYFTYAERISTTSAFSDSTSPSSGTPKTKKTGAETREEILSSLLSRCDTLTAMEPGALPSINESNFTLQLFQRTLEETLDSFQKSIHDDMRNRHIEILRQFHMHEMEMSSVMSSILDNQAKLMKEIKCLRKENQHLRQLL